MYSRSLIHPRVYENTSYSCIVMYGEKYSRMCGLWHRSTSQLYCGFLSCMGCTLRVIIRGRPLYHTQLGCVQYPYTLEITIQLLIMRQCIILLATRTLQSQSIKKTYLWLSRYTFYHKNVKIKPQL